MKALPDPAAVSVSVADPSPSARDEFLQHYPAARAYADASTMLAEPAQDGDIVVVATPPTSNALDCLDAPRKLSEAIDSPAIEWFRKLQGDSGSRWSLVGKTGSYVLKRLAKFVGSKFIDDLAVFFTEFNDVLGGFQQRAEETFALLRQPRVGFVLVASPEPMAGCQ